ncbi:MAG: hypothetical protein ACLFQZ_13995 [Spirochaetaceae bacterium]
MTKVTMLKRSALLLLLFLFSASLLYAFDWGGSLTNSSQFENQPEDSDEDEFYQENTLSLYLSTPVGENSEFSADAAYTFSTDRAFLLQLRQAHVTRTVRPDSGVSRFRTRIGRFYSTDPTGEVLRHPLDGVRLGFAWPGLELGLTAGYTGLLQQPVGNVSLSKLDQVDDEDEDLFAPSRLIGQINASMPELFLGQSVDVALLFQEDLRDPDDGDLIEPGVGTAEPTRGGLVDTQYAVLSVNGPLQSNFYYTVYGIANTGRTLSFVEDDDSDTGQAYEYKPFLAGLFGAKLDYFLPDFFSSRASLFGRLGTGDKDYNSYTEGNTDGKANLFTPITAASAGEVFGIEPGNSAHIGVSYSVQPFSDSPNGWLKRLQGELSGYSFFRTAGEGVTSVSAVDSGTSERYLGSEIDFAVRARPYSDFGIGFTTGLFFANSSAMFDEANDVDWIARLDASLSF